MSGLSLRFPSHDGGSKPILRDISLHVQAGECLALVGESGAGKSMLAHSILALHGSSCTIEGHVSWNNRDVLQMSAKHLRALRGGEIGMIFQEPLSSLNPVHRVGRQITESLRLHQALSATDARKKALDLLRRVRLSRPEERMAAWPHTLSGGERQRVMIAIAIANAPKLLIADEPTTALDVTIQARILALLHDLKRTEKMALLLITHDLNVVRNLADRVGVMRFGEIVEMDEPERIFLRPRRTYTKALLASAPARRPARPACKDDLLLQGRGICVRYARKRTWLWRARDDYLAVDRASIRLQRGRTLGLVGESGSGKSSLALALLRLIPCSATELHFCGVDLQARKGRLLRPLRAQLQVVFQDPYGALNPRLSVEEIVQEGLRVHYPGLARAEIVRRVEEVLRETGLEPDMIARYPHEFSGGQRQRIAIARALILSPKVLFLDEPTSALDAIVQAKILNLLDELQRKRGLAYLFISHNLRTVRALAHEIAVMKSGRIVEQGDAHRILTNPQHPYTKELMSAAGLD